MLRNFFRKDVVTPEDGLIDAVRERMHKLGPDNEHYQAMLDYLERLHKVKADKTPDPVSRDTMVVIAGNLLIVVLMLGFEQKHVITSKVPNYIYRLKTPNVIN